MVTNRICVDIIYERIFQNEIPAFFPSLPFYRANVVVGRAVFPFSHFVFIPNKLSNVYELITKRLCARLTIVHSIG